MQKLQEKYFFYIILAITAVLGLLVFRPFFPVLFLTLVITVLCGGIYRSIKKRIGSEFISALLTVFIVILIVFIPLTLIGFLIFQEATNLYGMLISGGSTTIAGTVKELLSHYPQGAEYITNNIEQYVRTSLTWVISHTGGLVSSFVKIAFALFLTLISLFYFFKDGDDFKKMIISYSPLHPDHNKKLIDSFTRTVNSVVRGTLIVAIIQGIQVGIGFAIFGVPNPVLWGTAAVFSALIPGVGTSLVMIPGIIFLFITGHIWTTIGLIIWAIFAVGLIDNFLGPYLVKRGTNIHPFFVLFSVLGGLILFGPLGFIVGPVITSLFFELLALYPTIVNNNEKVS